MACLACGRWHLPLEGCHQGDTAQGLALRDRLARARGALEVRSSSASQVATRSVSIRPERAHPKLTAQPEPVRPRSHSDEDKGGGVEVKGKGGGRPPGPSPWKDRKAEYKRAYQKAYMRGWRARKKGGGGQ